MSSSGDFQKGLAAAQSGDHATALREWKPLAEKGDANAQYFLGSMYEGGIGVSQNDKTAVKWWKLAAEQGQAYAQKKLGKSYAFGEGVLKDYVYAHMWANIAATNGITTGAELRDFVEEKMTPANISTAKKLARECIRKRYKGCVPVSLGSAGVSWSQDYQKGLAAAQSGDYATALREWTPLAEQGDANAQYNLGVMYDRGQGVPQDYKTVVKWFKLAAEQGHVNALHNLGVMYDRGQGVPQDYKTALKWYILAAEQGAGRSQYNVGVMYNTGRGTPQDIVYAHMWFNIAASSGFEDGVKARDLFAKEMTPSQLEKAQDLARECVRKKYKGC